MIDFAADRAFEELAHDIFKYKYKKNKNKIIIYLSETLYAKTYYFYYIYNICNSREYSIKLDKTLMGTDYRIEVDNIINDITDIYE